MFDVWQIYNPGKLRPKTFHLENNHFSESNLIDSLLYIYEKHGAENYHEKFGSKRSSIDKK